jgi:hypothetical protein
MLGDDLQTIFLFQVVGDISDSSHDGELITFDQVLLSPLRGGPENKPRKLTGPECTDEIEKSNLR